MEYNLIMVINGISATREFDDYEEAIERYNALRQHFIDSGFEYVGFHRQFFLYLRTADNAKGRIALFKIRPNNGGFGFSKKRN